MLTILFALTLLGSHTAAQGCQAHSFFTDFEGGNWQDDFNIKSGLETGYIGPGPNGKGLSMQLRTANASATHLASKLLWGYGTTFEITMQASNHAGVMSDICVWPAQGKVGYGEIDMEILGGGPITQFQVPIWKPEVVPAIQFANAPASWNMQATPGSPTIDFGDAAPLNGVGNWLDFAGFDKTQMHTYTLSYQPTMIGWTVDGQSLTTYTIGTDETQWPGQGPMAVNLALWAQPSLASWMGTYVYDPNNPPSFFIQSVNISGCVTNLMPGTNQPSSASSAIQDPSQIIGNHPTVIPGFSTLISAAQSNVTKSFTAVKTQFSSQQSQLESRVSHSQHGGAKPTSTGSSDDDRAGQNPTSVANSVPTSKGDSQTTSISFATSAASRVWANARLSVITLILATVTRRHI